MILDLISSLTLDPVVNFGKVTVSTGYTNIDTTIILNTGDGARLPDPSISGSFNLVWWDSTYPDPSDDQYVEIVRCIARVDDTLSIMRGQEGTTSSNKNIVGRTYKMILSQTKKTIGDIQTDAQSRVDTHSALSTGIHGLGADTIDGISARNAAITTHSTLTTSIHNFDASGNAPAQTHGIGKHTGTIGDHQGNLTGIGTNTHAQIDTAITNSTNHIGASSAHNVSGNIIGTTDTQTLTNKTITDSTNNVTAKSLKSATTSIDVSAATAPTTGQVLTATGSTAATWQTGTAPFTNQNVVTGSRANNTPYHNTSGKTMFVAVALHSAQNNNAIAYSDNTTNPTTVVAWGVNSGVAASLSFMVLAGNYYKVNKDLNSQGIDIWTEWT